MIQGRFVLLSLGPKVRGFVRDVLKDKSGILLTLGSQQEHAILIARFEGRKTRLHLLELHFRLPAIPCIT
jgi:hypothetical protein